VQTSWKLGSPSLVRYNGYEAIDIVGNNTQSKEQRRGDGRDERTGQADCRPASATTGPASRCRKSFRQPGAAAVRVRSIVVFLCLAALYESWSMPVAVLLVVPLGMTGCSC
jgi:multidrug efflux pump